MKKLEWARNLLRKNGFSLPKLVENGFVKRRSSVYIHKKKRIVVKYPYIVNDYKPKKDTVPTLVLTRVRSGYFREYRTIYIQPLIDTTGCVQAQHILNRKHPRLYDIHNGNVGWYKKKPVLFDW